MRDAEILAVIALFGGMVTGINGFFALFAFNNDARGAAPFFIAPTLAGIGIIVLACHLIARNR